MTWTLLEKLRKGWSGTRGILDAADVETTGSGNAQAELDALNSSVINWLFNSAVVDTTDPGASHVALNNAAKASATVITFSGTSNVSAARFDELLGALQPRVRIFVQDRNTPANSLLLRITATPETVASRINIQVAVERSAGAEFANDAVLNITFFPTTLSSQQIVTLTQLTNLSGTGDIRISNGVFQVVDDSGSGTPPGTHTQTDLEYGKNTSAALPVSPLTAQDTTVRNQWTVEFPALNTGEFWVFQLPTGRTLASIINPSLPGVDQQASWTQDGSEPRLWAIGPAVRSSAATILQITATG